MAAAPVASTIGTSVPRIEGPGRVTGSARFSADTELEGALWARVVRSTVPHARIISIDTAAAEKVPGVRAIVTAKDLLDPTKRMGRSRLKDVPVLCEDVVRFVGDRVAVIAAESEEAAEEAAQLVTVEYEELPTVFDPEEALEPGAPLLHPGIAEYVGYNPKIQGRGPNVAGYQLVEHGDVAAGFAEAEIVLENSFETQLMHHGYLEPSAFALQIDEGGRVHVWASNKNPFNMKNEIAWALGRPAEDIVSEPPSIGADFGGKAGQADPVAMWYLAQHTGRPIKEVLSYAEDLTATSPRHAARIWLRTGLKHDGTIVAHEGRILFNSGAYAGFKPSTHGLPGEATECLIGTYEIPNIRLEGIAAYTNQVPCGYMRAPGQPQAFFAVEVHMDLIARRLGMDPYELRLKNLIKHEDDRPDVVAPEVLRRAKYAIDWTAPKPPNVGRGLAIAWRHTGVGEGSSDITVNPDGTISVISGIPDNGPGGLTTVVQVTAEFFGIPMARVNLIHGNTDSLPIDAASAGSRVTNLVTRCVTAAGEKVIEQLTPLAAELLGAQNPVWQKPGWRGEDGRFISLEELARSTIRPGEDLAHAQVTLTAPHEGGRGYCAQAAEVEVDRETGEIKVRKLVSVQDVGTVLNTLSHRGQVQGSVVQGIGYALTEELTVEEGRVTTTHLGEYKLPVQMDVPQLEVVDVPSSGVGPLGIRSIGEIVAVPTAGAIAAAVMDATGSEIHRIPMTAERVLAAVEGRL